MITDLLKTENIKVNVDVNTWEEAGRSAGKLLVDTKGVEEKYVDAMIDGVKKYGPYIVIAKGIAIFHARPADGVKRVCMSLVTLKNGVNFNAGDKDPVELVFAFGAIDNNTHLKMLSEVMDILRDRQGIDSILRAKDGKEVLAIIKNKLEK